MKNNLTIKDLVRYRQKNYRNWATAVIYDEIESTCDTKLSEEDILKLARIGYEMYMDYDYATDIGVGVSIAHYILDNKDLMKNDLDKIETVLRNNYETNEWR